MVFSSLAFIFGFLPVLLAVYYFVDDRYKNVVLLVGSLLFYAWGGPKYLILLMTEALVSWGLALLIDAAEGAREKRLYLVLECVVLLGLLGYFKYAGWLAATFAGLIPALKSFVAPILPIGISFYTFQLISYVADVKRGEVAAQRSYWRLLLYCSLFHQCIAGPIVRYATVEKEIAHRQPTQSDVYYGVRRFCCGLAKKAVLANSCAAVADTLVPIGGTTLAAQSVTGFWLGMIFYTLQIYLDFSAYSDMAIGLGRMVGFHYLENFNYPYTATSVQDFWRRWHISLSSFFRDYVYIPLGGSRCATPIYIRNMAVVWLLTGLWHGASWNYVLWGLFYLALLLLERFVLRDLIPSPVQRALTIIAVIFGWVLFRFENAGEMLTVLKGMLGFAGGGFLSLSVRTTFLQNIFLLIVAIVACTQFGSWLRKTLSRAARNGGAIFGVYSVTEMLTPALMLLLAVIALAGASYSPFIYFQF